MTNTFTIDDIRAATDEKYGPTDIDVDGTPVQLFNALQLPKSKRKALEAAQDRLTKTDEAESTEDVEDVLVDILRIVAATPAQAEALLEAIGGNLALLLSLFEKYNGAREDETPES